jgi:hypothetical protein
MVATQSYDVKAECGPWVVQVTGNFHNVCIGYLEVMCTEVKIGCGNVRFLF